MCHALSLCRANKAKTKRCLSIKWQIQTKANQNQTKPNPFAHSLSMRINGSGAAADPRATLECPELLGLPSDKLFKSFSLFPIDDPINGFSKFIYCQLWEWKLSHTHTHTHSIAYICTYIFLSIPQLIILEKSVVKTFVHPQHKARLEEELVLRNIFTWKLLYFSLFSIRLSTSAHPQRIRINGLAVKETHLYL